MRASYIKPNSHTYVKAASFVETVREVLWIAEITDGYRIKVLFEVGCMIAEKCAPKFANKLLTERDYGFWAWWLVEFLRDDEALLYYHPEAFQQHSYRTIKASMLNDKDVSANFDRFLLNIIEPRF